MTWAGGKLAELAAKLERLRELTRAIWWADAPTDPVAYGRCVGVVADPWQARVLRSRFKQVLLNCCRQAGKSTTAGLRAAHGAEFEAGSLTLLISPSLRQSAELHRKVRGFLSRSPGRPRLLSDNEHSCELANGSRIISLPATEGTVRGFSAPTRIIEDEAGDVPDELYAAIRPMLAVSQGQLWLQGTPKGRRGHFYETWSRASPRWDRVEIPASAVPRIPKDFLDEERIALGALYAQEYECAFLLGGAGRVYDGFSDDNLIDRLPTSAAWTRVIALDFGIVDRNAIAVIAWRPHDPCLYVELAYRFAGDPVALAAELRPLYKTAKPQQVVGDVGGMGKAFAAQLAGRHGIPVHAAEKHDKLGNIALLNGEMRRGRVKIVRGACTDLVSEYQQLPWAEDRMFGRKEADGFANHCADAVLYGWRASHAWLEHPEEQRPKPGSREAAEAEEARIIAELEGEAERSPWERPRGRGGWRERHSTGGLRRR